MKYHKYLNFNYTNFTTSHCNISYPKNKGQLIEIINFAKKNNKKILPIGAGLSWYDTIFNTNNIIIDLKSMKKKFIFNKSKGELVVSSGYKIYEIISKYATFFFCFKIIYIFCNGIKKIVNIIKR